MQPLDAGMQPQNDRHVRCKSAYQHLQFLGVEGKDVFFPLQANWSKGVNGIVHSKNKILLKYKNMSVCAFYFYLGV